jgi:phage-related protein
MSALLLNGVSAAAYGFTLAEATGWVDLPACQTPTTPIPGRQGVTVLGPTQEQSRTLTLRGHVRGTTATQQRAFVDALKLALCAVPVSVILPDHPDRFYLAVRASATLTPASRGSMVATTQPIDITLTVMDPYAYDVALTTVNVTGASAYTAIPLGTAPVRPKFTMSGPNANPLRFYLVSDTVVTTFMTLRVGGTLGSGDTLVVDHEAQTIRKNGVNVLALLQEGDFFQIDPAAHIVGGQPPRVVAEGAMPFTVTYRKAWR